jgi:acetyl/propionyl-CoA carboxylase alpha subunit
MPRRQVLAVANRGEIAIRIARTARRLGWEPVALLGDPDLTSFAARQIDSVEPVGPAGSELDPALVVAAAQRAGADALHPGYGFLSERAELSQACLDAGIVFVGPSPETLAMCGDKIATREAAERAGVPLLPASVPLTLQDDDAWSREAERIGYPLIAKVAGGGGGRGLRVARAPDEVDAAVLSALREAGASGAGTRLYLERFLEDARHVEVQVAGNGSDAVALGDRDCSVQRRHQKVIEEAPAFGLADDLRDALHRHAVAIAQEVRLWGVGTVEFLLSGTGEACFIEINPRLQVEHTVTEEVTGLDLVEVQLDLAFSTALPQPVGPHGHAIQARLYAEDPFRGFAPSPGLIRRLDWHAERHLRVDLGYEAGDEVPSTYDSMIGKWIAWGNSRVEAAELLRESLYSLEVAGIATNRPWLLALLDNTRFHEAQHTLSIAEDVQVELRPPHARDLGALVVALWHQRQTAPSPSRRAARPGPWLPFRIVASASEPLHGDEAGGWQALVEYVREPGGREWHAVVDGDHEPAATLSVDGSTHAGGVAVEQEGGWELATPAGRWLVGVGPRPRAQVGAAVSDGVLRAPMPGAVVAVNAVSGQQVSKGDVLAVMTAMKIEITLAAPFDGIVASVSCAPGDLVGTRQALVTVTAREAGEETDG